MVNCCGCNEYEIFVTSSVIEINIDGQTFITRSSCVYKVVGTDECIG